MQKRQSELYEWTNEGIVNDRGRFRIQAQVIKSRFYNVKIIFLSKK